MKFLKGTIPDILGQFPKEVLLILGLSLNYAAANLAVFLWESHAGGSVTNPAVLYYLIGVSVFTLIFSIAVRNLKKCISYTFISIVAGIAISIGILLLPPVIYGSPSMIDRTITVYAFSISKYSIFSVTISMFVAILGSLLGDGI